MTFCYPELVTSPTRDCVLSEARGSALDTTDHFTTVFCASLPSGLFRGDEEAARLARRLMDPYVAMGCEPTWTCAPYQLPERPGPGEHVTWAGSNAIVFANSVLGAHRPTIGAWMLL
jgi:predicted aconitase